jgi:vancomycin resistance protein YoaR
MPIQYNGRKYRFSSLVNKIKNTKPEISNPNGYVATLEKRQNKQAQLKAQLQKFSKELDKKMKKKSQYNTATGEHYEDENERRQAIQDKLNKGAYQVQPLGNKNYVSATNTAESDKINAQIEKAKRDREFQQRKINVKRPGASY